MNTTLRGTREAQASLVQSAERLAWVTLGACSIALALAVWASLTAALLMGRAGADTRGAGATIVVAPPNLEADECSTD